MIQKLLLKLTHDKCIFLNLEKCKYINKNIERDQQIFKHKYQIEIFRDK